MQDYLMYIRYFAFDGNFRMGGEYFQCEIKFSCEKFSQTLPVSESFPCRIFSARMLAVAKYYLMHGILQDLLTSKELVQASLFDYCSLHFYTVYTSIQI